MIYDVYDINDKYDEGGHEMIAVSRVGLRSTRSVSALDLSDPSDLKSLAHDCGCFL